MSSIQDRLNQTDLTTIETSFPIPKAGLVAAMIADITENTVDDSGNELKAPFVAIKYTFTQDWETHPVNGVSKPILAGFPLTERVYVSDWTDPKTGEVKNFGITQLTKLREAVYGPAKPGDQLIFQELLGQSLILRLKYDPAPKNKKTGETYGPQTTVSGYLKAVN